MHALKLATACAIMISAAACGGSSKAEATAKAEAPEARLAVSPSGVMKVAFVVSDQATLIDIAGPMQVFDQVQSPGTTGFQTFTVSATRAPIKAGTLTIVPDYTFADAPDPDIVVVGAQSDRSATFFDYLRKMNGRGKLLLSVCTGVSKFAQAGILDGLEATSHHDFIDGFKATYPKVKWVPNRAWVHSAPNIYTAGGETSGMELALHIMELYFDHDVAVKTARYMEYRTPAWAQAGVTYGR